MQKTWFWSTFIREWKLFMKRKAGRPTSVRFDARRHVFLMETLNMFPWRPWTTVKRWESLKGDFEQFFLTRINISFNITQLDSAQLREIQRFSVLISRPWVTDWVPSGFHLLPKLNERLRWHQHASEDDSRQRLICRSAFKMHISIAQDLWNCLKVFESVQTAKLIMSRN